MKVAITGMGAASGFGVGAEPLWSALVQGRRAPTEQPELTARGLGVGPVALVPSLPFDRPDRALALARAAAQEALADAGTSVASLVAGTTLGGIDRFLGALRSAAPPNYGDGWTYGGPTQRLARELEIAGPVLTTSVACASGNVALGTALDLLRSGEVDSALVGGFDALNDFVISGFAALKALDAQPCRPFDRTRAGLNLGEGAAFLVLETEARMKSRGGRARAYLRGYGCAADAVHMTGPDREGRGAGRAMRCALVDAGVRPEQIDFVSAHGTATVFNDLMEAKALAFALGARAATVPVHSLKSALGHTLGAAGALEAFACVRICESGVVPPTVGTNDLDPEIPLRVIRQEAAALSARLVLSTSSGFGGTNAAIVVEAPR